LRLIQSRLFGLEAADPVAIGLGGAALGVVALIAARVDPMVAIRYE
jgi:hypothetical protein